MKEEEDERGTAGNKEKMAMIVRLGWLIGWLASC